MTLLLFACATPTEDSAVAQPCPAPLDEDGDGYVAALDCDDGDPSVHPDAAEVCDDGVDNDCDGTNQGCRREGLIDTTAADLAIWGEKSFESFGDALLFVPDADGDGRDELVTNYNSEYSSTGGPRVAVLFGGTEAKVSSEAETVLTSDSTLSISLDTDWGDFDDDGRLDVMVSVNGNYGDSRAVGWFPLERLGAPPPEEVITVIRSDEVSAMAPYTAWRTGTRGDMIVGVDLYGCAAGLEPCLHIYTEPHQTTSLMDADVLVWSTETWRWMYDAATAGGYNGTGEMGLQVVLTSVLNEPKTMAAVVVFDTVPPDGAVLSDAEHVIWTGNGTPSLVPPGDFNGDGTDDVAVSYVEETAEENHCVTVLNGPPGAETYALEAEHRLCGSPETGTFSHATVGDLDADGFDDLIVAQYAPSEDERAVARVFYGPLPTGRAEVDQSAFGVAGDPEDERSLELAAGGDFDGDGVPDLAIAASSAGDDVVAAGVTYLFYGQGG